MHDLIESVIVIVAPRRCAGCDEPARGIFCAACDALLEHAATPTAMFHYGGPIADAIHRYKYQGRSDLSGALGSLMARGATRQWAGKVDAVVPVPLHWRRRRARGYDQAALLAKPVARALGVPALIHGLRRVRHTPSQVELPHHERRRNVDGAFASRKLRGAERVLLVDDVRTTGATLAAASEALREGGVGTIHTLVLATRVLT